MGTPLRRPRSAGRTLAGRSLSSRFFSCLTYREMSAATKERSHTPAMKTIRPYINPEKRNHGFTLIELLVVIVILAILMAIAIPAYLSQQKKAKDSAAKQYLTVAWKSARTAAVDNSGNYPTTAASLVSTIQASEPELSVVAGSKSDVSATNDKKVV